MVADPWWQGGFEENRRALGISPLDETVELLGYCKRPIGDMRQIRPLTQLGMGLTESCGAVLSSLFLLI
jgi:hypothetical protein